MNKIKNTAKKIIIPATLLLYGVNVFALVAPEPITPPVVQAPVSTVDLPSMWDRLGTILNYIVAFVGIASFVFLLYGAYMYMSSGQNEDNLKKAKASFVYGIIGAVVAVLSFSVLTFVKRFIGGE